MSRRKSLGIRKPCGRLVKAAPQELLPPTEIRRLLDAAASGLRDSVWSSTLGRLHLTTKISASQFAAGKRWAELVSNYSAACQSPTPPRTKTLDNTGGTPADPDSIAGAKEARRHERATADYLDGRHALRLAGSAAERVVDSVCVQDRAPAGLHELDALRTGLQSLSTWWSASERKAHVRWRRLKSLQIVLRLRELFRASQEETMPIDRSRIRKGMFLVSGQPLAGYTPKREPHCRRSLSTSSRLPRQPIVFRPSITNIGPR